MSARKVALLSESKGRIVFFMFHLTASPATLRSAEQPRRLFPHLRQLASKSRRERQH
jgi:hypothetical protein